MSVSYRLAAIGLACALVTPASAQLLTRKDLSAALAVTIAQTAIAACAANGYRVSATVVGRNGEVLVQIRGDGTGPHTMDNSFRKAYTARTSRQPSGEMAKRLKADPQLSLVTLPNMVAAQGALPIIRFIWSFMRLEQRTIATRSSARPCCMPASASGSATRR